MIVVMMGVSGSGKTTIGKLLAEQLNEAFADADDYHSTANKAKMAAGHPLDDDDRQPWLQTLNAVLQEWQKSGKGGILACSALKEKYRGTLAQGMPTGAVDFVLLSAPLEVLAERLAHRQHEFMDPHLLPSQLETLETPKNGVLIMNDHAPDEVVEEILRKLKNHQKKDMKIYNIFTGFV